MAARRAQLPVPFSVLLSEKLNTPYMVDRVSHKWKTTFPSNTRLPDSPKVELTLSDATTLPAPSSKRRSELYFSTATNAMLPFQIPSSKLGMETPPVLVGVKKTLAGSLSKSSLTPCRRPGLSRPSSSSLSRFCRTSVVCTPNTDVGAVVVNECESSESSSTPRRSCDERLKVPLKLSDAQNKHSAIRKVRRRLTVVSKTPVKGETGDFLESASVEEESQTCKKSKLSLDRLNSDKKVGECSSLNTPSSLIHKANNKLSVISPENIDEVDGSDEEVTADVIEKLVKSIQEKKKKLDQLKVQQIYAKKVGCGK